ncbi:transcriptional regulatory protein AfsQ1 [Ditylenchus destructor]|uniref:Transcriptional regulatory protein AfsQ1 n=1 Tax=Ditylenchus destructor TaxID=166010 RepID=A0AAD4QSY7_9BILA|nr:transcriptional regulatory protein AfsQ1 [Ditylenchus destructor]
MQDAHGGILVAQPPAHRERQVTRQRFDEKREAGPGHAVGGLEHDQRHDEQQNLVSEAGQEQRHEERQEDDLDHILGLESGADDYVIKPIKPPVLLARLRALQRRQTPETHRARLP